MSIVPPALLPFINNALDEMVRIAETLGDERVNQRPHLPHTNSPYAIWTHCVGVTHYWLGHVIAGRAITRDREAKFQARGTVTEIHQAVRSLQEQLQEDIRPVQGDQSVAHPVALHGSEQDHTQGDVLLHCYREFAQHHGQMELTRDILLSQSILYLRVVSSLRRMRSNSKPVGKHEEKGTQFR